MRSTTPAPTVGTAVGAALRDSAAPKLVIVELTAFAHATLIGSFDPKPNMASLEKCVSSSRLPSRTVILLLMLE